MKSKGESKRAGRLIQALSLSQSEKNKVHRNIKLDVKKQSLEALSVLRQTNLCPLNLVK